MAQEQIETFKALCAQLLQKTIFDGPYGRAWQEVMGASMDEDQLRFFYARAVRWPSYTPTDALFYLAAERGLERVILVGSGGILEDETKHRERLKHAWTIWRQAGSAGGHVEALSWPGYGLVKVVRRHDFSTPPAVGSPYVQAFARQVWSQFDVVVRAPSPVQPLLWGGFTWGSGASWGTTMTPAEIDLLRRLIRDHKSAHNTCTYVHFAFSTGGLWGLFKWGDGTLWGGVNNGTTSIIVGEPQWKTRGYV